MILQNSLFYHNNGIFFVIRTGCMNDKYEYCVLYTNKGERERGGGKKKKDLLCRDTYRLDDSKSYICIGNQISKVNK